MMTSVWCLMVMIFFWCNSSKNTIIDGLKYHLSPLDIVDVYLGILVEESQQLKEAGLKITLPRLKVLQILEQAQGRHLSAEDVYKMLLDLGEDVGLATVYRVLTQFQTAGLITRHNFEGGYCVFELSDKEHHDHLVCIKCGLIEEFFDNIIEEQQSKISAAADFKMTDHALTIYGFCRLCHL